MSDLIKPNKVVRATLVLLLIADPLTTAELQGNVAWELRDLVLHVVGFAWDEPKEALFQSPQLCELTTIDNRLVLGCRRTA